MNTARNMSSRPGTEFDGQGRRSLLEIDTWIRSKVSAISPLVERLMSLIEGAHCNTGDEPTIELALREALNNAVVHGNQLNSQKLVHVRCRCSVGKGISITVSDQGAGFDLNAVPDPLSAENLMAEHGRGIHLMKLVMDEVSFDRRGAEVHMVKRPATYRRTGLRK